MRSTFLLAATLLLALPVHAAEANVLKVSVVHATKTKGKAVTIDPKLKRIGKSLTKAFSGYQNFKRLSNHELKLTPKASIKLPGNRTAVFTHKGKKGDEVSLNLAIPKSKVDVSLRSPPGRVFFQAGLKHDKGILILALYLRPPKK